MRDAAETPSRGRLSDIGTGLDAEVGCNDGVLLNVLNLEYG